MTPLDTAHELLRAAIDRAKRSMVDRLLATRELDERMRLLDMLDTLNEITEAINVEINRAKNH